MRVWMIKTLSYKTVKRQICHKYPRFSILKLYRKFVKCDFFLWVFQIMSVFHTDTLQQLHGYLLQIKHMVLSYTCIPLKHFSISK